MLPKSNTTANDKTRSQHRFELEQNHQTKRLFVRVCLPYACSIRSFTHIKIYCNPMSTTLLLLVSIRTPFFESQTELEILYRIYTRILSTFLRLVNNFSLQIGFNVSKTVVIRSHKCTSSSPQMVSVSLSMGKRTKKHIVYTHTTRAEKNVSVLSTAQKIRCTRIEQKKQEKYKLFAKKSYYKNEQILTRNADSLLEQRTFCSHS